LGFVLLSHPLKKTIACVPRHLFPGPRGSFCKQVSFRRLKGKFQGFGQPADEGRFVLIFSGSQAMIKVGDKHADVEIILESVEKVEKADRVRASGDRDNDRIPFGDHLVTRDGVFDLLEGAFGGVHEPCLIKSLF
jgi:hypothetical protein